MFDLGKRSDAGNTEAVVSELKNNEGENEQQFFTHEEKDHESFCKKSLHRG